MNLTHKKARRSLKILDSRGIYFNVNNQEIKALKKKFLGSETKGLNKNQFKEALLECARLDLDSNEFNELFFRINTSGDGTVSWDEFISYLIVCFNIESVTLEMKSLHLPICQKPSLYFSQHKFPITSIIFNFQVKHDRSFSYNDGNYITCSKDGTINYWFLDYALERSEISSSPDLKITSTCIISLACLSDVSVICTAATERDLRFYDTSAKKFELRVHVKMLDYAISAMDYVFPTNPLEESKLIMGNTNGDVIIWFFVPFNRGPFKSKIDSPLITVNYCDLTNKIPAIRVIELKNVHPDWILQIEWYPNFEMIISCSSSQLATVMRDIRENRRCYKYYIPKGALCFRAHREFPLLATGGNDSLIRIWNPFVPKRPINVLSGHHAAVIALIIQEGGEILLSLSLDKVIKIWNINDRTCIQTYLHLGTELGASDNISMFYNPSNRQIIIGGKVILVLNFQTKPDGEHTDGNSHVEGVSVVLYNPIYKVVVSCSLDSDIIIWDPWLGRRRSVIRNAHTIILNGELVPVEITAATFDEKYQHLLTGANDGSLKTWNFNTGTCIKNLNLEHNCEVTGVSWFNKRILAIGWNNYVTEFFDIELACQTGSLLKKWPHLHRFDVLCIAAKPNEVLVTAGYDGDLILWSYETGQPYRRYNVVEPTAQVNLKYAHLKKGFTTSSPLVHYKTSAYLHAVAISEKIVVAKQKRQPRSFRRMAVRCMLILNTRPKKPDIATLLVSVESGQIQVYSHHKQGCFIMAFDAVHSTGDCVTAMISDEINEYLICGTSEGYIKIFLLKNFYSDTLEPICMPYYRLKFPFLWKNNFVGRSQRRHGSDLPLILNSFKAHRNVISSLAYIDTRNLIVSGSADSTIRIFNISGKYLGLLGSFKPWTTISQTIPDEQTHEYKIPADIRRIASSTTLRVYLGKTFPRRLNKKQKQAIMERTKQISLSKSSHIFGKTLLKPILGNYFRIPKIEVKAKEFNFNENLMTSCVYQHAILHSPRPIKELCPNPNHLTKKYKTIRDIIPNLPKGDLI